MSHLLKFRDGKAAMMYVGEAPWHRLGTRLQTAPKTADEAIKAAGLDWEVGLMPLYARNGSDFHELTDRKITVRMDDLAMNHCAPLGFVGNHFKIFQNRDAFRFFDPVIATGKVEYHTAGAIGNGERVWVLAKVAGDILVKGRDRVEKYLLLSNGHNGITPLQVRFTPIRVVCNNTLSAALRGPGDLAYIRHDESMPRMLDAAIKQIFSYYENLEPQLNKLADYQMDNQKLTQYIEGVFPTPSRTAGQSDLEFQRAQAETRNIHQRGRQLFEQGMGNTEPSIRGTLWAAYNAVTELIDHHMTYESPSQRLDYVWFGHGERVKQSAFNQAIRLCYLPGTLTPRIDSRLAVPSRRELVRTHNPQLQTRTNNGASPVKSNFVAITRTASFVPQNSSSL